MKVFISQPMNGRTEEEIRQKREAAIKDVRSKFGEHVEIMESCFDDYDPGRGCVPLKYLAKSIELLAEADLVYFAPGFDSARGCWIEYECAKAYGIETHVALAGAK